jgi:PBP1b-binding outer membrane lipoprotein LpoB
MKKCIILLSLILFISGCAGLGVATVGAVMYYKSQNHEVATVDISAPAKNVYMAATDAVEANSKVVILNKDDSSMQLDLLQNETNGSIKVMALTSTMTKLTITSGVTSENETSPLIAVLKICKDLKVECKESK